MSERAFLIEEALRHLLPDSARCVVSDIDGVELASMSASERAIVANATIARQREFAAGRSCARRVLVRSNLPRASIGKGPMGEPLWPVGVVGSISHATGVAAAVAAPSSPSLAAIGIDIEHATSLERSLWPSVLAPAERLACERSGSPLTSATVLFSAKEAIFKAQYPLTGHVLEFLDMSLEFRANGPGELTASIAPHVPTLDGLPPSSLWAVRHAAVGSTILAVATIPSRGSDGHRSRSDDRRID